MFNESFVTILLNIKRKQRTLMNVEKVHKKLKTGLYYTDIDGKLSLNPVANRKKFDLHNCKDTLVTIIKNKYVKVRNNQGKYDKLLITANQAYKYFNLTERIVLTIAENERIGKIVYATDRLGDYFKNTFICTNEEGIIDYFVDGNIVRNATYKLRKYAYMNILECIVNNYSSQSDVKYKYISEELRDLENYLKGTDLEEFRYYFNMASSLDCIPMFFQHCDIHFENMMVDEAAIYYLDFEYARYENFLFDIFNCAYVEFIDANSHDMIDFLISDDLKKNDELKHIFTSAGMEYKAKKIKLYFYRFMVSRIVFDVSHIIEDDKKYIIKKLLDGYRRLYRYLEVYSV